MTIKAVVDCKAKYIVDDLENRYEDADEHVGRIFEVK